MGRQDDLGAALLAAHPRGDEWRQLDVTVTALTFAQIDWLAAALASGTDEPARWRARTDVVAGLVGTEIEGRLGSRWVRWCSTFGLQAPPRDRTRSELLMHPYRQAQRCETGGDHRWARYVSGVSALFDAALGVAGTDLTPQGFAQHETLTAVWSRVCLPCRFGPGDVFGPGHRTALTLMNSAAELSRAELDDMIQRRTELGGLPWHRARREVDEAAVAVGFPFRSQGLFWEAVAAAEDAAGQSPTDPQLADALWGAAAAVVFTDQLSAPIAATLAAPWGRPLHPVSK